MKRDAHDVTDATVIPPDLAAIAAAADEQISGAGDMPGQDQAQAVEVDRGAELGAMLSMGVMMATPALPFLKDCYPPETCKQIGIAFAAVAEKYGWNLDAVTSPELALAVTAIPPTVAAIVAGRAHFAELRAQAKPIEGAVTEQPAR